MHAPERPAASSIRRFAGDVQGVAAVEMALIAPAALAALLGVSDVGLALLKYRQATQAASSVAHTAVHLAVVDAMAAPGKSVLPAGSEASSILSKGLALSLGSKASARTTASAVRVVRAGAYTPVWTWTYGGTTNVDKAPGGQTSLASNLGAMPAMKDGESFIVAEVTYAHPFVFMPGSVNLTSRYFTLVPSY